MPRENEKIEIPGPEVVAKVPERKVVADRLETARETRPLKSFGESEVVEALETAQTLAEPTGTAMTLKRNEETKKYLERYLPEYLKQPAISGILINKAIDLFFRMKEKIGSFEVEGRENIPAEGPFLIVCNHRGGETGKILALFGDKKVHISAGEELNFKRSEFRAKLLKKIGMLPVKESLSNLDDEAKKDLLERVPARSRAGYEKVLARESLPFNREFIRSAVAALLKGEPVVIFPEGLFTYEGDNLRQAYGGWELIVREYKRVTGEDLPLLPVGLTKNTASVGSVISLAEVQDTNGLMRKIAELLPENMRGVYKE
ncbi:MAG: 1-acyl-sn-glycerol-3-phosphate acyltransferase [Candidatus Uhrbacteria bacterium]